MPLIMILDLYNEIVTLIDFNGFIGIMQWAISLLTKS